ncbi:MAG: glycosyltransferase family 4 protein [Planctomycetes bacterium]|nr:glycosyltransferase family 4 protein [Planctomycetota bacterium]
MQRNLLRCAQALRERGHEVSVVCTHWEGRVPEGLELVVLPNRSPTNHGRNRTFAHDLQAWVAHRRPDVVVGFDKLPGLDIYYAADPCLAARVNERAMASLWRILPRYRTLLGFERAIFGKGSPTRILLHAPAQKALYEASWGTEPSRFIELPPGLDTRRLDVEVPEDRVALRQSFGLGGERPLLLLVGSSFRTKGVDRFLGLIRSLPEVQGLVVGRDELDHWRGSARRLGIADRVVFSGPRDDVVRAYRAADLLVHPARVENTGNTLLEAMYCGLPVLCSGVCGFSVHVERAGAGWVLEAPHDAEAWRSRTESALADESDRMAKGERGRRYCREHDLHSLIDRAVAAIESHGRRPSLIPEGGR